MKITRFVFMHIIAFIDNDYAASCIQNHNYPSRDPIQNRH